MKTIRLLKDEELVQIRGGQTPPPPPEDESEASIRAHIDIGG